MLPVVHMSLREIFFKSPPFFVETLKLQSSFIHSLLSWVRCPCSKFNLGCSSIFFFRKSRSIVDLLPLASYYISTLLSARPISSFHQIQCSNTKPLEIINYQQNHVLPRSSTLQSSSQAALLRLIQRVSISRVLPRLLP